MRFIGNKQNLVETIHYITQKAGVYGNSLFDCFSGTANVAKYFKKSGYQVYSSDLLYFSYVLQKAYIVNNQESKFEKLLDSIHSSTNLLFSNPIDLVVNYLNNIPPIEGFIYKNYTPSGTQYFDQPRMYFIDENGKIIDAIRQQIELWKSNRLIDENEYYVLLACLIETVPFYANVAGVFAAFQKKWDPRAIKKLILRPIKYVVNTSTNYSYNMDSLNLLSNIETDIFYLDPPYNQRQYAPNYHILETIAKYDDPIIKGITGLRGYENQKSKFCNPDLALKELDLIARKGKFKYLILSYNTEGIMTQENIISILKKYGEVSLYELEYLRFKSHNNGDGKDKKYVFEQLYIMKK